MFDYLIDHANDKGCAFAEIILRLTNKQIMMIDTDINPIQQTQLKKLTKYKNFYYMFGINKNMTFKKIPYVTFVYTSTTSDQIRKNNCIYLVDILLLTQQQNTNIIAKLEALQLKPALYVLQQGMWKYPIHYYNTYILSQLQINDILFNQI